MRRFPALALLLGVSAFAPAPLAAQAPAPAARPAAQAPQLDAAMARLEQELAAKHGAGQRAALLRGMRQVAALWRAGDGDAAAFEEFVRANWAAEPALRDAMFRRYEELFEKIGGHMNEITLALRRQSDLDLGPILPFDEAFAGYDPAAHLVEDFFRNKLAFRVLLNFPLTTLEERLREGEGWSRRQWAEARLTQLFSKRVPAEVRLAQARAISDAGQYIAQYNIWMHHLLAGDGRRLFPPKMRLLSHWNLRDEIRASYADAENGLAKQRLIQRVMERIVTQTIPAVAVNNPKVDWEPAANQVKPAAVRDDPGAAPPAADAKLSAAAEPNTRYARLLGVFRAMRLEDPYSPAAPTLMARRFDEDRELPEARVKAMLVEVLTSPLVPRVARLIEQRLGRKLEAFDIWYAGFQPRSAHAEAQLDEIVRQKYPTAEAFERDIPNILTKLGFSPERAAALAANIVVEPARGSGHAWGAAMRAAKARLRTRVEKDGMNYKGYNIAVHELGHNVEQTISLNDVDHTLLQGVPNNAFTEALAFVFQAKDLDLLGLAAPDARAVALQTLHDFWGTYEIAGVALVDIAVWHWMYDHPAATPAELRDATVAIAKDVWNRYYAPVFGRRDVVLLGIYSHMIEYPMYLPDYPIGHLIAHQIEEQMHRAGNIGPEFDRMARMGRVAPDQWMKNATGRPVGPEALLEATARALAALGAR
jgi:hypothetical protein